MRIVVISDTHSKHEKLNIPKGDVIIHCGDITQNGSKKETIDFLTWFEKLEFKYKIFIAGNHDKYLEKYSAQLINKLSENTYFLNDSSVKINGKLFWGSAFTPEYKKMAFNKERHVELRNHWRKVPNNTDILITHGPPSGILDSTIQGDSVGCEHLRNKTAKIRPRFHFFGHIHESAGTKKVLETTYVNASQTNKSKNINFSPKQFTFEDVNFKDRNEAM